MEKKELMEKFQHALDMLMILRICLCSEHSFLEKSCRDSIRVFSRDITEEFEKIKEHLGE